MYIARNYGITYIFHDRRATWAYEQRDWLRLVTLQWSGLWDVISLRTLCWEIGDNSRSWNKNFFNKCLNCSRLWHCLRLIVSEFHSHGQQLLRSVVSSDVPMNSLINSTVTKTSLLKSSPLACDVGQVIKATKAHDIDRTIWLGGSICTVVSLYFNSWPLVTGALLLSGRPPWSYPKKPVICINLLDALGWGEVWTTCLQCPGVPWLWEDRSGPPVWRCPGAPE